MTQSNNNRIVHFNTISFIALVLIISVLATLAKAGGHSPISFDSEHNHYWPEVNTAVNTLLSIFIFVLSTARTIVSKTTYIAFAPVRFSWRATKWVTLTLWSSVVNFASIPVVAFILVAIGCGVVIGGCAGFAVELFTALLYSATWGKKDAPAVDGETQDSNFAAQDENDSQYIGDEEDEYDGDEDDHDDGRVANNAIFELLQQHLTDVSKDQYIRQRRSPSTLGAAAAIEAYA